MSDKAGLVTEVLQDLGITHVVIVDDEWGPTAGNSLNDLVGALRSGLENASAAKRRRFERAFAHANLDIGGPWSEQLEQRWNRTDDDGRVGLRDELLDAVGLARPETSSLRAIQSWLPEEIPSLIPMLPATWREEGAALLRQADSRVVCLFDLSMGTAGNEGETLLRDAIGGDHSPHKVFFGILTAKGGVGDEEDRSKKLQSDLGNERVVVISKGRAADGPEQFAMGLRRVVMRTYHDDMRKMVLGAIEASGMAAAEWLSTIQTSDFDQIVVATAQNEGTWEGDELLRLTSLKEQAARRRIMLDNRESLAEILGALRAARPRTSAASAPVSARVREIRRLELYAGPEINEAFLPVELGDIFLVGGDRSFILVGQNCDLSIRSSGRRSRDPRNVAVVELASEGRRPTAGEMYPLEHYGEVDTWVAFHVSGNAPLAVLDLVACHGDGSATISLDEDAPGAAFESTRARYGHLRREFRALAESLASVDRAVARQLSKEDAKRLRKLAVAPYAGDGAVSIPCEQENGQFTFGVRRIGRVLPPRAADLLTRYHQFRARPAFEADFARLPAV